MLAARLPLNPPSSEAGRGTQALHPAARYNPPSADRIPTGEA